MARLSSHTHQLPLTANFIFSFVQTRLESIYLEGPTKDVIAGVEFILKSQAGLARVKERVSDLESSEKLLQRQRFKFSEVLYFAAQFNKLDVHPIQVYQSHMK